MKVVEPPSCSAASAIVSSAGTSAANGSPRSRTASMAACSSIALRRLKYALFEDGHQPETIVELARDVELDIGRCNSLLGNAPVRRILTEQQTPRGQQAFGLVPFRRRIPMTSISTPATWLAGCIPDIPTPFDDNGALDLAAFAGLCERQIVPASAPFSSARPAAKPPR